MAAHNRSETSILARRGVGTSPWRWALTCIALTLSCVTLLTAKESTLRRASNVHRPLILEPPASDDVTPASSPETDGFSWGWMVAGLGLVALAAASFHFIPRLKKGNDSSESENPFQTITLNPIRRDVPKRQESRQSHTTSVHKIAGTFPSPRPAAQGSIPTAEHFIYAAAHDLQEPLRKIRNYMDRLDTKLKAAQALDARTEVESVAKTLQRMQSLLDSLLSLARIQGKGASFATIELGPIVRDVLVDLEVRIAESGGEVSVEGTFPEIAADATQLHQLLQNLIANALKFHQPGRPPKVVIRVKVTEDEPIAIGNPSNKKPWCEIQVEDNGIGFEPSDWASLLEGFRRLHSRDEYEGTGLGLTICRSIVDRHQGTLQAISRPNEGTTITVRLPLQQHARSGDTSHLRGPVLVDGSPKRPSKTY